MNAGGITYSGILGNRKVTLPSVESWGTNMNILKDPPKSIHTRKIDKVFDTQEYSRMVEESVDDRQCENIQVYPRGINPSVSVSYGNYGNNGGKLMYFGKDNKLGGGSDYMANGIVADGYNRPGVSQQASSWKACQVSNGHTHAKYPYRVDIDGAFRPPLMPETRLMPLSRQPRLATNVFTNPFAPKYAERNSCIDVVKRSTVPELFNTTVQATSTGLINPTKAADTRQLNSVHMDRMINSDMANKEMYSQKSENIHLGHEIQTPTKGIQNIQNTQAGTNRVTKIHDKAGAESFKFDTKQYITTPLNSEVHSKFNQLANIDLASMYSGTAAQIRTRDLQNNNVMTNQSQYRNADIEADRVPIRLKDQNNTTVVANTQAEYYKNNQNTSERKLENKMALTDINTPHSAEYYNKQRMFEHEIKLEPNRNHTTAYTNPRNMQEEYQHNRIRDANLKPRLNIQEGFDGMYSAGTMPTVYKDNDPIFLEPRNISTKKQAYNQFADRFQDMANVPQ